MRRNRLAYIAAALLVALLAVPSFAHAARGDEVIADCHEDGHIDGSYSQDDYQEAQDNLPSDIDQYGSCRDVIAQAQADGSRDKNSSGGGGSGSGGSGGQSRTGGSPKPFSGDPALETESGAYAPNQDDKKAYDRARAEAATEANLPGGLAIPAAGDFKPAGADNAIPLPVLLALVSVGLLIAATTALVARKRLPALTSAARRVVRR
jgi:hypothetical protein